MCDSISVTILKVGGNGYATMYVLYDFFFPFHLQVDNYIPKHYLPPIIRLCGKLEMLDRLLPKLKATDHRVCKILYVCCWITTSNFFHIGIDIGCYNCDERYFVNLF